LLVSQNLSLFHSVIDCQSTAQAFIIIFNPFPIKLYSDGVYDASQESSVKALIKMLLSPALMASHLWIGPRSVDR